MYRKITGFLKAWKESKHRKWLVFQGARQVGMSVCISLHKRLPHLLYTDLWRIPKGHLPLK